MEEGHWGCRVVLYKPVTKTIVDEQTGDEDEERFFVLRTFTVFNADQADGDAAEQYLRAARAGQGQTNDAQPDFQPAEELISATGADIRYGGDRAFYHRPLPMGAFPNHREGDFIVLPPRTTFDPPGGFYETAVHELAHWSEVRTGMGPRQERLRPWRTGSRDRLLLRRHRTRHPAGRGTRATMPPTCGAGWRRMKGDRNFIFKAAKQAGKVTDFLLGFVKKPEPEAVGATA